MNRILELGLLSPEQLSDLSERWLRKDETFTVQRLAVAQGLEIGRALAVFTVLQDLNMIEARVLIFHAQCDPNLAAGSLPFGKGLPTLPWLCPLCEEEVVSYKDLFFEIEGSYKAPR